MFRQMLIPLDGSPLAEQVLPLVKLFVEHANSAVVLLRVVAPIHPDLHTAEVEASASAQTEQACQAARDYLEALPPIFASNVAVARQVILGSPATTILEVAEKTPCDLIAMVTHGRTGIDRWVYGSVADKVLSGARLPILLVRANQLPRDLASIKHILIPLDGSPLAEHALVPAQQLAHAFNAKLVLFRVLESYSYAADGLVVSSIDGLDAIVGQTTQTYLDEQVKAIQAQGIKVSSASEYGVVADRILEAAHRYMADLIVMSTHGRSGLGRWVMGSVADRVLRASPIPVLLIRAGVVVA